MANYIVTTTNDALDAGSTFEDLSVDGLSLREAILLANTEAGADIITFDNAVLTGGAESLIRLTMGELEITDAVTIDGSTATDVTITGDANGDDFTVEGTYITDIGAEDAGFLAENSRVFNVTSESADTTLDSLTITGGRTTAEFAGGGGILSSASLTLANSTVSGNSTAGNYSWGGGVQGLSSVTLTNTTVSGNGTSGFGGSGGGIFSVVAVTLTDSTVSGNTTTGDYSSGGGINGDSVTLTNTLVSGNATYGYGASGGGIDGTDVTSTDSIVRGNMTAGEFASGGGIRAVSLMLTNSTVSGNATSGYDAEGGGIFGYTAATLTNSTVSGNATYGESADGGGIAGGTVTLTGSTVSGNATTADFSYGGGIGATTVTLTSSTVSGNATGSQFASGGGIFGHFVELTNSIVLGNDATQAGNPEIFVIAEQTANGLNIVGTGDDADGSDGIINADPAAVFAQISETGAGVLADNGGSVQTIALKADITNPALDAANSVLTTDARGVDRDIDLPGIGDTATVDLGAFELQQLAPEMPQAFVVTTSNDELDFNGPDASLESMGGAGDLSLREAIFLANHASAADTITFDSAVFTGGAESLIRLTLGELEITDAVTIDGSTATDVTITGDTNDDDVTVADTDVTDLAASGADLLDDNVRVFNITYWSADTTLDSLTITGGRAISVGEADATGGGIQSNGRLTIANSTISGNSVSAEYYGGGGGISAGSVTLTNSVVSGNTVTGFNIWGGGVGAESIELTNSTVNGNALMATGSSYGGGLSVGFLMVTNSTVSGNTIEAAYVAEGGGIQGYYLNFTNATISGNSIEGGEEANGGGISGAYVDLRNSIVLGNDGSGSPELHYREELIATGLNIVGTGSDTDGSDGIINADPTLVFAQTTEGGAGVLADNGGPVETIALMLDASNPALDQAIEATETDARGFDRVDLYGIGNSGADFADLGAFEASEAAPTSIVLTNRLAAIAENRSTASKIKVADIVVTDADGGPNTLSLAGADKALFEIFNGDLYLKAGAKLDFETNSKLDVTVQISADLNGPGVDQQVAFSLKVSDVDEATDQRIIGTRHRDVLKGGDGDDLILGLAGNDRIAGNAGHDRIIGGLGIDRMRGGDGDDIFVFGSIAQFGPGYDGPVGYGLYSPLHGSGKRDIVADFDGGHDRLDFSAIDANADRSGNQAFKFLGAGELDIKGSLIYRTFDRAGTTNDMTIVYGDVDGNGLADFQLELTGIHKLTAADFIL